MWRARLFGEVFALDVRERVFLEGNAGVTTLLRTIVDEAVFADLEIARAGSATPVICLAACQVFLEPIKPAVTRFIVVFDFPIDAFFTLIQWLHGTAAIMDDSK